MKYAIAFIAVILLGLTLQTCTATPKIISADKQGFIVNQDLVKEWDLLVQARGVKVHRKKGDRTGIKYNNYATYTMTLDAMSAYLELREVR